MASLFYVTTGSFAVTAATAKIPLEITPASTKSIQLVGLDVSFDTVFGTTVPLVELCTYGTVGSGGSAPTPTKMGDNTSDVALTVTRILDTTAPTTIVSLIPWYWSGFMLQYPLGREVQLAASSKNCVRVTSPSTGNCAITAYWTE